MRDGVSLEDTKSTLVALYASPSLAPMMAPVDLVVSFPLRKSPTVPSVSVVVLPSVYSLASPNTMCSFGQAWSGDHRVKAVLIVREVIRMILLHASATCALCSSTLRATREYEVWRSSLIRSVTGRLSLVVVPEWSPLSVYGDTSTLLPTARSEDAVHEVG